MGGFSLINLFVNKEGDEIISESSLYWQYNNPCWQLLLFYIFNYLSKLISYLLDYYRPSSKTISMLAMLQTAELR